MTKSALGTALAAILGAGAGGGIVVILTGMRRSTTVSAAKRSRVRLSPAALRDHRRELALALLAGCGALALTRWPVAFVLGAAASLALVRLRSGSSREILTRLDAIASWTEMLRDTLAGAAGLTQALVATAPSAPAVLRPSLLSLSSRLESGIGIDVALAVLATDLDDMAGDLVVASLLMAARERSQRLGDLLGHLAETIREEVDMRRGVETSRASVRTATRMVSGCSLGLFVLVAVFAHSYLEPYRTLTGQLVLLVVGLVFGLGMWLMALLVRPRPSQRLELAVVRA